MCEFCEVKLNNDIGIECGEILLKDTATVITKNNNGKYILDSNEGSHCEIDYCPKCGKKLLSERENATLVTRENLLKEGYKQFKDDIEKANCSGVYICSYNKDFNDENGKKYYVLIDCFDLSKYYNMSGVNANSITFDAKTQFYTQNIEHFSVKYFVVSDETTIEGMETFFENMWKTLNLKRYDELY
jgi:Zn-finger nucleic acid-binding protein